MDIPVCSPRPVHCLSYDDIYNIDSDDDEYKYTIDKWNEIERMNNHIRDLAQINIQVRENVDKSRILESISELIKDMVVTVHTLCDTCNSNDLSIDEP